MENYIHCIDLTNPVTCWNIVKTKQLWSYRATLNTVFFPSKNILEIPISDMYDKFHTLQIGLGSHRGALIFQGSLIRSGMYLAFGMERPKTLDPKFYPKILELSDAEIQFEKIRREINSELPSRLTSIFIAEDSYEARIHLSEMLSHIRQPYIVNVSFENPISLFRADSKFFEEYVKSKDRKIIEKYWNGEKFSQDSQYHWEYIFEGVLDIKSEEQLADIKKFGVFEAPEKE
jgi:hypothetical protein